MSKAEMILYSPASYFLCIIVVQIIKKSIFLWDICVVFFVLFHPEQTFEIAAENKARFFFCL